MSPVTEQASGISAESGELIAQLSTRLEAIVDCSDDAIISEDLDGIIQSWNHGAARMFGYTAEEMIGRNSTVLAAPGYADQLRILSRVARGETVEHFETRRLTKDGRIIAVSLTVSPIKNQSGAVTGCSKIARDITERESSQQELRASKEALVRANADLEQFSYLAAHDLQEPLRMVTVFNQLLKERYAGKLDADADQYIRYSVEGASRIQTLVHDLLEYTRTADISDQTPEVVETSSLVLQVMEALKAAIEEAHAQIVCRGLPAIRTRVGPLRQIFQILISNAIKYKGEQHPQVVVSGGYRDGEWIFSVSDNGIGIDPLYKDQIFGLFKRLHRAPQYPGTGIGLAICKRLIEQSGGRIWVESALGRGATFFFTLPKPA